MFFENWVPSMCIWASLLPHRGLGGVGQFLILMRLCFRLIGFLIISFLGGIGYLVMLIRGISKSSLLRSAHMLEKTAVWED